MGKAPQSSVHESNRMDLIRNSQGMKREEEPHEATSARAADPTALRVYLTCLIKSFGSLVGVKCYQMQNQQQDEKCINKLRRHIKLFKNWGRWGEKRENKTSLFFH